jgi:uncharacterized protein (TIGR02466 family)
VLNHLFTTPVEHHRVEVNAEELAAARDYLLELRGAGPGERRSNRGGWHSQGNLFDPSEHRQFPFLSKAVTDAVLAYFHEAMGFEGELAFTLTGWAVINGPGDTNAPHNHPRSLLSGAFYLQVPEGMRGGEIVFMDPRFNANAYGSAEMRRLGLCPPWDRTVVSHMPTPGDLLIFPSWLMHYVERFEADAADAQRIVISFNVAV